MADDAIALVAPYLPGTIGPRSARSRRLARELAVRGFAPGAVIVDRPGVDLEVDILAGAPGALVGELESGEMSARLRARSAITRRVRRVVPLPDAHVGWAMRLARAPALLVRPPGVRAVYAIGYPFSSLVLGAILARRWRVPLIGDLGDPWPVRSSAERRLVRWTFDCMAAFVVTNELTAGLYRGQVPEGCPIVVAPNGADELRGIRSDAEPPLFLHLGTISDVRIDPGPAFRALGELDRAGILRFRSHGESWVPLDGVGALHHGVVGGEEARRLMRGATAMLVLGNRSPVQIPSKAYEIARSDLWGLYVSELEGDPGAEVLRTSGHGVVAANSIKGVKEAALEIIERGATGRSPEPVSEHSWEATVESVVGLVAEVAGGRRR